MAKIKISGDLICRPFNISKICLRTGKFVLERKKADVAPIFQNSQVSDMKTVILMNCSLSTLKF